MRGAGAAAEQTRLPFGLKEVDEDLAPPERLGVFGDAIGEAREERLVLLVAADLGGEDATRPSRKSAEVIDGEARELCPEARGGDVAERGELELDGADLALGGGLAARLKEAEARSAEEAVAREVRGRDWGAPKRSQADKEALSACVGEGNRPSYFSQ